MRLVPLLLRALFPLLATLPTSGCHTEGRPGREPVENRLYDLSHSLPIAEQRHERRTFDVGAPQARASMLGGWSWNERRADGTTFAWSQGPESILEIFLLERRPFELRARAFAHPALTAAGTLSAEIELNGFGLGSVAIGESLSDVALPVPVDSQVLGNNRLVLRPSRVHEQPDRSPSIAWDRLALVEPSWHAEGVPQETHGERLSPAQARCGGVVLPAGIQVAWPLELGPGQELLLDGLHFRPEQEDPGPTLRVLLETADRSELLRSIDTDVVRVVVPLPLAEPSPAWLLLQTSPVGGGRVELDRAWVVRANGSDATKLGAGAWDAPSLDVATPPEESPEPR